MDVCLQRTIPVTAVSAETPRATRRKRFEFEETASTTGDSMRPQARKRRVRLVDAFHSITLLDKMNESSEPSRCVGYSAVADEMADNDDFGVVANNDLDILSASSTLGDEDDDGSLFMSDQEILQKKSERKVLFELVFPDQYKNPIDQRIDHIILENAASPDRVSLTGQLEDEDEANVVNFDSMNCDE